MTDQHRGPRVPSPDRAVRLPALVIAAAIAGGSLFAAAPSLAHRSARSDEVVPSERVMRELRATIITLYGPRPAPAGAGTPHPVRRIVGRSPRNA